MDRWELYRVRASLLSRRDKIRGRAFSGSVVAFGSLADLEVLRGRDVRGIDKDDREKRSLKLGVAMRNRNAM